MLTITVKPFSVFDEATETFITLDKPVTLKMEHSLLSISKWEQKIHKPLLEGFMKNSKKPLTPTEFLYYCECMCLNEVESKVFYGLSEKDIKDIVEYINNPMTATWFGDDGDNKKGEHKILTNERIYGYMVSLEIPFSCEKWHINRLMTLITVCSNNNNPKKMSKKDTVKKYADLNRQRRAAMHTKG